MSSIRVSCPFEDCRFHNLIEYVELNRFKRHLAQDHDRSQLIELAYKKGIIQDPIKYHNHNFIIQRIALGSKVKGGFLSGGY